MKLSDKVQAVLDSDISGYRLYKEYGINDAKVSRLRSGKNPIGGITLDMAEKFEEVYAKEITK